jgi:hypothetical protein
MVYAVQQRSLEEWSTGMTSYAADHHRAYLERGLGLHAAYTLHYHLVWSVRARRPLLQDTVARALRDHLLETSPHHGG